MEREFLQGLDLGGGARLPEEAVEAILAEAEREAAPAEAGTPELPDGRVRFTARMAADDGGQMTKEQIMAIRDRKRRRAAIAQNLNLFEKEN